MFEIGLDNPDRDPARRRCRAGHRQRAGGTGGVGPGAVRGGGPSCQLTYREYLTRLLAAMGIDPLPDEAFSTAEYATDWLDTEEKPGPAALPAALVRRYRRGDRGQPCWKRRLASAASPLARAAMLRLSPYYKKTS